MAQGFPVFSSFNVQESAMDTRWKKRCARPEILLVGLDIKDDKRKRALLLHYSGKQVNDIFDTLPDTSNDYATALDNLTNYFAPKKCTEFEIYKFRQATQEANEPIDTFHNRPRKLSENCKFDSNDKKIKSQIIQGCASTLLQSKALRDDMTFDTLIKEARALELSEKHASQIEQKSAETNPMFRKKKKVRNFKQPVPQKKRKTVNCRNCGLVYPHEDS